MNRKYTICVSFPDHMAGWSNSTGLGKAFVCGFLLTGVTHNILLHHQLNFYIIHRRCNGQPDLEICHHFSAAVFIRISVYSESLEESQVTGRCVLPVYPSKCLLNEWISCLIKIFTVDTVCGNFCLRTTVSTVVILKYFCCCCGWLCPRPLASPTTLPSGSGMSSIVGLGFLL